jgi:hypothetical protein
MEVERPPLDPGAEPALEPRRPFQADVAEGSYVVAPDDDLGGVVGFLCHAGHCRGGEGDPARARTRRVRLDEEPGVPVDLPENLLPDATVRGRPKNRV